MSLVPAAIGNAVARNSLLLQKNSPGLLFGAGIVGVVAGTVLACRATLKMDEVLDEAKEKLDTAKTLEHKEYSERDRQKDISTIYIQTGVKIVRTYAPAIIVSGLSIAALTRSHNILTQRNAALTAAYAALEKGFAQYRARVVEKYGEDEDRHFRYGTETVTVGEGKEKKELVRVSSDEPSIYARFFDQLNPRWEKNFPEANVFFLKCQQNHANDLLRARGHVFLNEVYDMLGFDRTEPGAVVGWLLGVGDDFIDFGIWNDIQNERINDFLTGREGAILLDFNVDGVIYDKLELT